MRCKWGVFVRDTQVHVAPCSGDGTIAEGHEVSEGCPCEPVADTWSFILPKMIWTHHESSPSDDTF